MPLRPPGGPRNWLPASLAPPRLAPCRGCIAAQASADIVSDTVQTLAGAKNSAAVIAVTFVGVTRRPELACGAADGAVESRAIPMARTTARRTNGWRIGFLDTLFGSKCL